MTRAGVRISYGADVASLWRRGAYYVDRVFKGAKPADLPVEQPTKFELVINLKTAEGPRADDPADAAAAGGSGHTVMDRRAFIAMVGGSILGGPLAADGQQVGKVYRIGYLTVPSREAAQGVADSFQLGLRDLGWIEGQNVVVDYRFADSNLDRLPDLAAELARLRADVIVAGANAAVIAAKTATRTIPIVMFLTVDPVGSGLVASLARPGGNVTGLTTTAGPEIYGKQLQLLKDAFPRLSRVAVLVNPALPSYARLLQEVEIAPCVGAAAADHGNPRSWRVRQRALPPLRQPTWTRFSFPPIRCFINTESGSRNPRRRPGCPRCGGGGSTRRRVVSWPMPAT
jgi:ABC-type uncharacterized transport system substrate-binding protein